MDRRELEGLLAFTVVFSAAMVIATAVGRSGLAPLALAPSSAPVSPSQVSPPVATGCRPVPLFPGSVATVVPQHSVRAATAVEALRPGGPAIVPLEARLVRARDSLGRGLSVFEFYRRRMYPVDFGLLPSELRRFIGVRTHGPVDSPPAVYLATGAAVVIRVAPDGDATLLVFGCAAQA